MKAIDKNNDGSIDFIEFVSRLDDFKKNLLNNFLLVFD